MSAANERERGRRSTRSLSLLLMALLAVVISGCSPGSGAAPTSTPIALDSAAEVQTMLSEAADNSRLGDRTDRAPAGASGRELWVGQERVLVYELDGTALASRVVAQLQAEGQRRLWALDHIIISYSGSDGGTVLLLTGLLGDADAGGAPPGGEPYPPGVSAAIITAAEAADVSPARVEVASYNPGSWPDGCLGLPAPGESCSQTPTDGWVVRLEAAGQAFEVHSDLLGAEVRIR